MTDYISREEAIRAIVDLTSYHTASEINIYVEAALYRERTWIGGVRDALIEIGDLPAADVRPVVHGRWEPVVDANEDGSPYQAGIHCSECGHFDVWEFNFCPNCGADMREEADGHE